uniref:C2H2-type domain-containing protein n=1 Tax=Timema tahoe TaxID=61484 RepID=A0A7R9III9_9NEOP|nr:unnamed protein product [Timema tahoe]
MKVIFRGSVPAFMWRESGKPFWNLTTLSTPDRDSNLDLPVIGSLVYCESSSLEHVATEAVGWPERLRSWNSMESADPAFVFVKTEHVFDASEDTVPIGEETSLETGVSPLNCLQASLACDGDILSAGTEGDPPCDFQHSMFTPNICQPSADLKLDFTCQDCNKVFKHLSVFQRHRLFHTGERPHKCGDCGNSFTLGSHLKRHQVIHTGVRDFECSLCSKKFAQKGELKIHIAIHMGYKPFGCNLCDNKFADRGSLEQHKLVHTGERPHICLICDKTFRRKTHLRGHVLTHSREKSYKCYICGALLRKKMYLKGHLTIHAWQLGRPV